MIYVNLKNSTVVSTSSSQDFENATLAPDWVKIGYRLNGSDWESVATDESMYSSALTSGYTDPILGVKIKTTKEAQQAFTSLLTMLQEGISLGLIDNDSNQVIWNYDNQPVTLTVLQIRQLMFRYGLHCKSFFDNYAP